MRFADTNKRRERGEAGGRQEGRKMSVGALAGKKCETTGSIQLGM